MEKTPNFFDPRSARTEIIPTGYSQIRILPAGGGGPPRFFSEFPKVSFALTHKEIRAQRPYNKEHALFCPFYGQNAKNGVVKMANFGPFWYLK